MKLYPFALLLCRFYTFWTFIAAIALATQIPSYIYSILDAHDAHTRHAYEFGLTLYLIRTFIYLIIGLGLLIFSRPVAKLLTKGLDHDESV
jgi:hypothetical protein